MSNNSYDLEDILEKINNKIKEVHNKIESRIIEQEYEYRKFNNLILKELNDLLLNYEVEYKLITLV